MKKILSTILLLVLLAGLCIPAYAEGTQKCAVIGANLTEEQIATVYAIFGIERGSVTELQVTNAEERSYLEGLVADPVIGTRSISCVYVQLLEPGAGMPCRRDVADSEDDEASRGTCGACAGRTARHWARQCVGSHRDELKHEGEAKRS